MQRGLTLGFTRVTETNATTDGTTATVNAGQGEAFLCSFDAGAFSCMDTDQFIWYGWENCAALHATTCWALSEGGVPFPDETTATSTPVSEPNSLALLATGLLALALPRIPVGATNKGFPK